VVDSVLAVNVAIYKSAEEGGGFRKYFAQMEKKTKKKRPTAEKRPDV
jgi:phage anti-repressor protein